MQLVGDAKPAVGKQHGRTRLAHERCGDRGGAGHEQTELLKVLHPCRAPSTAHCSGCPVSQRQALKDAAEMIRVEEHSLARGSARDYRGPRIIVLVGGGLSAHVVDDGLVCNGRCGHACCEGRPRAQQNRRGRCRRKNQRRSNRRTPAPDKRADLHDHNGDRRDVSRKMKCRLRIGCACRTVSLNVSSHGVMKASAREDAVRASVRFGLFGRWPRSSAGRRRGRLRTSRHFFAVK